MDFSFQSSDDATAIIDKAKKMFLSSLFLTLSEENLISGIKNFIYTQVQKMRKN